MSHKAHCEKKMGTGDRNTMAVDAASLPTVGQTKQGEPDAQNQDTNSAAQRHNAVQVLPPLAQHSNVTAT